MIDIKPLASGSMGNAYFVADGQAPLLLEAGIPWKHIQRGLNYNVSSLAGCLVSHEHGDHAKSVKDMVKAGIDCYMSQGTAAALGATGHRIRPVKAQEQFAVGTWTVLPFETEHDCADPLGFLLANQLGEKLLYLTDTAYCRYKFNGLSYIMLECNYSLDILRENVDAGVIPLDLKNRIIRTHFGLNNVKDFLKANDLSMVQEVWLIHMSEGNSDEARFKREIQELTGKPVYVAGGA